MRSTPASDDASAPGTAHEMSITFQIDPRICRKTPTACARAGSIRPRATLAVIRRMSREPSR